MTARPGWSPADYDRWLDSNLDALEDDPITFDSERAQIELDLAELDQMRKVGHWDADKAKRLVRSIVDCAEMLPDLMDQQAQARCI